MGLVAVLVNNGELNEKDILLYFKPLLLRQHDRIFKAYPDLKEDEHEYEQFKKLYEKWKDPSMH